MYLVVVMLSAAGLILVTVSAWRRGIALIGIGLLLAASARLALTEYDGGMLRVRKKWFDVLALAAFGVLLLVLAKWIPNQHP